MKKLFTVWFFLSPAALLAHSSRGHSYSEFMVVITIPFVYYLLDRKLLLLHTEYKKRLHVIIPNILLFALSIALMYNDFLSKNLNFFAVVFVLSIIIKLIYYAKLLSVSFRKLYRLFLGLLFTSLIGIIIEIIVMASIYIAFM